MGPPENKLLNNSINLDILQYNRVFCKTLFGKTGISQDAVAVVVDGAEIFMPLEDLIDMEKEIDRLEKEKANLEMELDRVNKKLSNESFVAKAPASVIEGEREKLKKYTDMYEKIIERLETLIKH